MFDVIVVLTSLSWVLIILNVADAITTYIALSKDGVTEGNPIIKYLIDRIGVIGALLLAKGSVVVFLLVITLNGTVMPIWLVGPLVVFYIWVVINNIKIASHK